MRIRADPDPDPKHCLKDTKGHDINCSASAVSFKTPGLVLLTLRRHRHRVVLYDNVESEKLLS